VIKIVMPAKAGIQGCQFAGLRPATE